MTKTTLHYRRKYTVEPKFVEYFVNGPTLGGPDTILYRFESHVYVDKNGEATTSQIYLNKYHVKKENAKTFLVDPGDGSLKTILKVQEGKRWAYTSKNLAWESFKKRVEWRAFYSDREAHKVQEIQKMVQMFEKDWDNG